MAVRIYPLRKKGVQPTSRRVKQQGRVGRVAFALLVSAAVLALAFFLVLRSASQVSIAENAVGTLLSPIARAVSAATVFVRDTINGAKDYVRMTEELQEIKQQLTDVKVQLMEYQEDARENARLTELLGASQQFSELNPIFARVIGKNPGVWFNTFNIDRGTNDGVFVNMAVIVGDGLVGHVYEAGATYAKVMTVVNEESAVSCLIERSRENCVMYGPVSADAAVLECQVRFLPQINDIVPGDVLITSGIDGLYPKGIKVGTVTQVSRQQSDVSDRFIYVAPSVDFLRLEEVLVLRVKVATDTDVGSVALLTPSPRPTISATPAPSPTPDPNAVSSGLEEPFRYPDSDATLNDDGTLNESQSRPPQQQGGASGNNMLIEDEWAR